MDFEIKGLNFEKRFLEKTSLDALDINSFCYTHIFFWPNQNSRPILLKKAGEFLDKTFFEKYQSRADFFYTYKLSSVDNVLEIVNIFQNFSHTNLLKEKMKLRSELLKNIFEEKYTEAEIQIAFQKLFNNLPKKFFIHYAAESEELLVRSSVTAMMSVIIALIVKYDDYKMIKDLYNLSYFLDYGLVQEKVDYRIIIACEKERELAGMGLIYLEKMKVKKEVIKNFINHPYLSSEKSQVYQDAFTYPELLKRIVYHHERKDGTGFPEGINYFYTSKVEQVLITADNMIPFKEKVLSTNKFSIKEYYSSLKTSRKDLLSIDKIFQSFEDELREAA